MRSFDIPTGHNTILDLLVLLYGLKVHISLSPSLPWGSSDHICVHVVPVYSTLLKRGKVLTEDTCLSLQGCLDCTDWQMFKDIYIRIYISAISALILIN